MVPPGAELGVGDALRGEHRHLALAGRYRVHGAFDVLGAAAESLRLTSTSRRARVVRYCAYVLSGESTGPSSRGSCDLVGS